MGPDETNVHHYLCFHNTRMTGVMKGLQNCLLEEYRDEGPEYPVEVSHKRLMNFFGKRSFSMTREVRDWQSVLRSVPLAWNIRKVGKKKLGFSWSIPHGASFLERAHIFLSSCLYPGLNYFTTFSRQWENAGTPRRTTTTIRFQREWVGARTWVCVDVILFMHVRVCRWKIVQPRNNKHLIKFHFFIFRTISGNPGK